MTDVVGVNDFVKRQVEGSGKSWSPDLTFEEIASHAESQMKNGAFRKGYRDGVRIVAADKEFTNLFICPFVRISRSTPLKAEYISRMPGEEPYIQIRATSGKPLKAGRVEFILYRKDVLAENNENSTTADWELISIHAIPVGVDTFPMGPVTMMRNQLELTGGTKAKYSSEEWAESVRFWQQYAAIEPEKD